MKSNVKYVIVGGGAQAKYVIDILVNCYDRKVIGILDVENNKEYHGTKIGTVEVIGYYRDLIEDYSPEKYEVIVCHSDNRIREKIYDELKKLGYKFSNVIHPSAYISKSAKLGEGNIINSHVSIMPFAKIGNCVIIHSNSVIEHDCEIEDFVNIAPSVALAGYVKVGKGSYIFTNATVLPGVKIGKDAKVGAGSVVLEDVQDNTVVKGVPAR